MMKNKLVDKIIYILVIFLQLGCNTSSQKNELFQGDFAGIAEAKVSTNNIVLKNKAIKAVWTLNNGSVFLKELYAYPHLPQVIPFI